MIAAIAVGAAPLENRETIMAKVLVIVPFAFDEKGLLNPGKMFPTLQRCAELGRMHISGGKLPFQDIPRF